MSIPYVTDGVTEMDSALFNPWIDRLDGNLSDNYQVPLAANDTGVAWPMHGIDAAQGEIQLDLMFRPSAGTATIEAGYWRYRAERIG